MIIRIQSPQGVKRIECDADETTARLMSKIQNAYNLESVLGFYVYKDKTRKTQIPNLERKSINDFGLKHGDMLYMEFTNAPNETASNGSLPTKSGKVGPLIQPKLPPNAASAPEDEVDQYLWKQNGMVERPKDPKLCRHGANAKCVHCSPLEPYNETYLKEHNIKHMSFHSYLRKMTAGVDRGKFAALENISCTIKPGCKGHPPWPNGICTKCQPNAVTLNRQVYRHVDGVVFENASIVERFLNYWRTTGHQRIGILYGYYEAHKDIPLGIKAVVVAIYEPPQESTRDLIKLHLPEKNELAVEHIASRLGLSRIGWIFTDLIPEDVKAGTVKHLRNSQTYFLSAQECIMAAYFQTMKPNRCRLSPEGFFGSKFVTICVTGDRDNQVHMEGYQVSNQCMALVRDNCFLPTKDAPELGYVRETSKEQFVPDVFFKEKDNFGNEITKLARLLPIEYLLVDVPVSSPVEPRFMFNQLRNKPTFPVENRFIEGHLQDFNALMNYFNQFGKEQFLEAVSDFHLLLYLSTMEMLPLKDALDKLLDAVKARDRNGALEWSKTENWATVEQLILAQGSSGGASQSTSTDRAVKWSCKYCTFENLDSSANCEMCGLPK